MAKDKKKDKEIKILEDKIQEITSEKGKTNAKTKKSNQENEFPTTIP